MCTQLDGVVRDAFVNADADIVSTFWHGGTVKPERVFFFDISKINIIP
jgi:hypothetical protein